jgi:hypothetical protein
MVLLMLLLLPTFQVFSYEQFTLSISWFLGNKSNKSNNYMNFRCVVFCDATGSGVFICRDNIYLDEMRGFGLIILKRAWEPA